MGPGLSGKYHWLALATVIATFLLILLGGIVRITGSGLGCPDWPLCHGRIIPPLDGPTLIEYSHRLAAATVSVLVLATAVFAWRGHRSRRWVVVPATLALALLALQVVLGGVTVLLELPTTVVVAHLGTSEALFASLLVTLVAALKGPGWPRVPALGGSGGFWKLALATAVATYVLLLSGAYVAGLPAASSACPSWPFCQGGVLVAGSYLADIHMLHRFVVAAASVLVLATFVQAIRTQRQNATTVRVAALLLELFVLQIALGAVDVLAGLPDVVGLVHLGTATAVWGTLVVLATLAYGERGEVPVPGPDPRPTDQSERRTVGAGTHAASQVRPPDEPDPAALRGSARRDASSPVERSSTGGGVAVAATWGDLPTDPPLARAYRRMAEVSAAYLELTKPRIVVLLLITTLAAMLVASPPLPGPGVVLATILGGYLAAGGANALNNYLDRDIDPLMRRTRRRPLPTHRVEPEQALVFGAVLGLLSFATFAAFVNVLAGELAVLGLLFYVFVYTRMLKRTTPQNIVIGGAAGAIPPLVGWAAARGEVTLPAFLLFAVIFFWTPPHFWSLSLLTRADYEAAGVPMLPIVAGEAETRMQVLLYSVALAGISLMPFAVGAVGLLYLGLAAPLGVGLVVTAARLVRQANTPAARRMFLYSNVYLALLFLAMVLDRLVLLVA